MDAAERASSPIELSSLGRLQCLRCGFAFDDLEENTATSEEVHRRFLHVIVHCGSSDLFNTCETAPATSTDAKRDRHEFEEAGFAGCIGSTDAAHVAMLGCPSAAVVCIISACSCLDMTTLEPTLSHCPHHLCLPTSL